MITGMSHTMVYVLDQDAARAFYTESLGFEVRTDVVMGKSLDGEGAGFRWLTVGPKGQPEVDIVLADCGMGHETEAAEQLRRLVAKGTFCGGVLSTGDCHATHRELLSKGVTFLQDPVDRPYGVEAVFRDDSGNWFSLTQDRRAATPD